ncbi:MAG TPA: ADOP family duplicated permease [Vicinamibacterales bacterium]|nr:ADOP family duplicated permease [Vicinamibacterales bacterium]
MLNIKDDVRLAYRRLSQRPGFTAVALLTLALGLGANTAIFTLIRASMFQTLPVDRPHELVRLGDDNNCCVNSGIQPRYSLFSVAGYQHLRDNTPELASLAAFQANVRPMGIRRLGSSVTDSLPSAFVSANYFTTLGVRQAAGRLMTATDDAPGADPVFVISHRVWTERFARDERVVGAAFLVGDHTMTLVGVTAEGFYGEAVRPDPAAVWLPLGQETPIRKAAALSGRPGTDWLYAIGRLAPGATIEQVQRRTSDEIRRWLGPQPFLGERDRATLGNVGINVISAAGGVSLLRFTYERPLGILFVMSGIVLLIAAANLANLLLSRSDRSQAAIQTALGASSGRLVRQSLVEGILLAAAGGAAGLLVAWLATRAVVAVAFPGADFIPLGLAPDLTVLAFALGLSTVTGVLFSSAPAWAMARTRPMDALRSGRSGEQRSFVPRRSLVVLQVALSVVLLSGAGLLTESLRRLEQQPLGFDTNGRIVARIQMPAIAGESARLAAMYDALRDRLRRIPGVQGVTYALYSPMQGDNWSSGISIDGLTPDERGFSSSWNRVGPAFFETHGTRIVRGRAIEERDTPSTGRVAVVNETFVRRFLAEKEPIGQHLGIGDVTHAGDYEIVGVSEDVKFTGAQAPTRPMIFLPIMQSVTYDNAGDTSVQSRSQLAAAVTLQVAPGLQNLERQVKDALAAVDPAIAVVRLVPLADQVSVNFRVNRLMATLTGAYGLLALALASLGLYGVTAYGVAKRTREIGIRMALGADRTIVVRDVLRGALTQTGAGLLLGIPAALFAVPPALAATGTTAGPLYGIDARDPTVLTVAALVLIGSAAAAAIIPARRAAAIDPTRALRAD